MLLVLVVVSGLRWCLDLGVIHWILIGHGVWGQVNVLVVIVTFGVEVVTARVAVDSRWCSEGHGPFGLDRAALPGLVDSCKLSWG